MNIGLLVTELEDRTVKRICIGAGEAARDKNIRLIIIPGGFLAGDKTDTSDAFGYQNNALFDFCLISKIDAVIIDIDRIGSRSTILKKEALLKKFDGIPVVTLSEQEGFSYLTVTGAEDKAPDKLGYEAVCHAVNYVKTGRVSSPETADDFMSDQRCQERALDILAKISSKFFLRKYEAGDAFKGLTDIAKEYGIDNCGVLLYDKAVMNTRKYPWTVPEMITSMSIIIDGKDAMAESESSAIATKDLFSIFEKSSANAFILKNLYISDIQLGIIFSELVPVMLTDHFFESLRSIITGISRVIILENELKKTGEELVEVQELLARDDSVLDHIGDQDYLTGLLNRRGFFAKAYDLLKDNFTPGRYAIVAYIHMESLKRINEIFGHDEGDRAVKRVAKILDQVFGDSIYGRIRGDEFAVISITDDDGAAENLRDEMSDQNNRLLAETGRYINRLQYSICEFGYDKNLSLREMLKETDENLQRLKGRNS